MMRIAVISCFLILLFSSCWEQKNKTNLAVPPPREEQPSQESWNSKVVFTDSGKTKVIVQSGYIRVFTRAQETRLDSSVQVDFYDRLQQISTTLTSKRGKVDDRTRNLYAYENVIVKNVDGTVLTTEELVWNDEKQKITTDKFVTIVTPKEKLQGCGFESDQYLRNYIIYRITYVTSGQNISE